MPTSPLFDMQKYQECLFCSNTRTFYKFEADAFFAGVQTNEPTDAKDYGVPATFLVTGFNIESCSSLQYKATMLVLKKHFPKKKQRTYLNYMCNFKKLLTEPLPAGNL